MNFYDALQQYYKENNIKPNQPIQKNKRIFNKESISPYLISFLATVLYFKRKRPIKPNKPKKPVKPSKDSIISEKIKRFIEKEEETFNFAQILKEFGDYPKCYLTGRGLNWNNPKTISFDHFIPKCKGGSNKINNLKLCCPEANLAKHKLTYEDFITLTRDVYIHKNSIEILNCP